MTHPLGPVCRYFSKPGVGVERSAVPGAPAGHPGQASGSGNGGAQRGDAAGCPAFQRGQRPAASPPATAQLQARQLEAAEEAYRAPGPGLRLPAATCTGGGRQLGQNVPAGTFHTSAGRVRGWKRAASRKGEVISCALRPRRAHLAGSQPFFFFF